MDYYTAFFAVVGVVTTIISIYALLHLGKWFDDQKTLGGAVVFVLGGSLILYAMFVCIGAAFTQQVKLEVQPTFLFIPLGLALAAVMELIKYRKRA